MQINQDDIAGVVKIVWESGHPLSVLQFEEGDWTFVFKFVFVKESWSEISEKNRKGPGSKGGRKAGGFWK